MQQQSDAPVAVVTGGAGGIGAATVRHLAEQGWRVAVLDRDGESALEVAREVGGLAIEVDIASRAAMDAAAARVVTELGPVTGLVAGAAHLENPHAPQDQDPGEWDRVVQTNLTGTFTTMQVFGRQMLALGRGSIVTLGSITALNGSPLVAYSPTKAAILAMTRNFAGAWGRQGVRVNCVCPGPTRTPAAEASYSRGERNPETMRRQTALGRLVMPMEVAQAIGWLLSPQSSAVTGIILPVDAGVLTAQLWNLYGGLD